MRFYATPPVDGALSEFVLARADLAYDLPASVSDDAAALLEPLSVGIWANQKGGTGAGSAVLIAGAGPIGLVTASIARVCGAGEVVVSDVSAQRLEAAVAMGATAVVDAGAGAGYPGEYDVFVDCSGAPAAIVAGIRALRPGGRAVLVGMGPQDITLPFARIQQRELVVTGTFRYASTWPTAIALAASGQVRLDRMVTGRYGLAEAEQALTGTTAPGAIKSVIEPWR
jgi:L-iditol 2-dehydrogenase